LLNDLSNLQVRQIALQRNDELRQMYWANICLFDPDMLVFVVESGFVTSHVTYRWVFFHLFLGVVITGQGNPTND